MHFSIKRVQTTTFLGVIIDQHLTWNDHILAISNKIARNIGVISRLRHVLPQNIMILLYNSMILPYLTYCNVVWANTYPTRLQRLFKLQKRIVRICSMSDFNAHSKPLFQKLNFLNIYQLNQYCITLMVFKHKHNKLPQNLATMLKCKISVHNYNTRNPDNYYIEKCTSTSSSFTFKHTGPIIWNSLPAVIRNTAFLNSFKSKMKKYLIKINPI